MTSRPSGGAPITLFPSVPTSPAGSFKAVYFELAADEGEDGEAIAVRCGPEGLRVATLEGSPGKLEWLGDCAAGGRYSLYAVNSGLVVAPQDGAPPPGIRLEDPAWHVMRAGSRAALVPTDGSGPALLGLDLESVERIARAWMECDAPAGAEEFERVLAHARILHRISLYGPQGILADPWSTPCRTADYQRPMIAMWDTIHIVLDLLAMGEGKLASAELANHYALQDEKTGQMAQDCIPAGAELSERPAGRDEHGRAFGVSQPPVWAQATLEVAEATGDGDVIQAAFPLVLANIEWWEGARRDAGTGLFFWRTRGESGGDNSPRFGAATVAEASDDELTARDSSAWAAADLCAQMHLSYEAAARMAEHLGEDPSRWDDSAGELAGAMNSLLWSEADGLYLDMRLDTREKSGPRTVFGLWPLVSSAPGAARAARMVEALREAASFWRELPVPSVAVSEESHALDMWRGPVWLSQNLWMARGLARHGYAAIAAELARRSLRRAQAVLDREGAILEFYPPDGVRTSPLRRKAQGCGPRRNYIGHAPLWALARFLGEGE